LIFTISDGNIDRWMVACDNCYAYENLLGINNNGVYLQDGFGVGSQVNMTLALDKMMELVNGNIGRIIIGHEPKSSEQIPSWKALDSLYIGELHLAPGERLFRL